MFIWPQNGYMSILVLFHGIENDQFSKLLCFTAFVCHGFFKFKLLQKFHETRYQTNLDWFRSAVRGLRPVALVLTYGSTNTSGALPVMRRCRETALNDAERLEVKNHLKSWKLFTVWSFLCFCNLLHLWGSGGWWEGQTWLIYHCYGARPPNKYVKHHF